MHAFASLTLGVTAFFAIAQFATPAPQAELAPGTPSFELDEWGPAVLPMPAVSTGQTEQPGRAEDPKALFDRMVVAGASLSAGFGPWMEFGKEISFADVLDAGLSFEHRAPVDASDRNFFRDPEGVGRLAMDKVLQADPTLVVALDYLFWFAYGYVFGTERMERFEYGLQLLDEIKCPVLVGTVPDMTPAVGMMLAKSQVPDPESLKAINKRLREWVSKQPNRRLIDLSSFLEKVRGEEEIKFGPVVWPGEDAAELLFRDNLHPTIVGTSLLAALVYQDLREYRPGLPAEGFNWDAWGLSDLVLERADQASDSKAESNRSDRDD